jgi:hypothetical protein
MSAARDEATRGAGRQDARLAWSPDALTRRRFARLLAAATTLPWIGSAGADPLPGGDPAPAVTAGQTYPQFDEATATVSPWAGYRSRIALKDGLLRVVRHGVLDRGRFIAAEGGPKQLPEGWLDKLSQPSNDPIYLTRDNAAAWVDLLWPIGLANHMAANAASPLAGHDLPNFASTGGWSLGRRANGAAYFNRYRIVDLTSAAEALAVHVAKATFRPCCDNSTFFQDCNHGSALLGLLQLGAAQGLDETALYVEALAFNSFWFPDTYIRTALYFKAVRNTDWLKVDPRLVMGAEFSTASGWQKNILTPLQATPGLIPPPSGGVNCGA